MLWILLIVALIVAFIVFVASRPAQFSLSRSITIQAPQERIRALLANFHPEGWGQWSPWEKIDPALNRAYSGSATGVGAIYEWQGPKAGSGRMEILDDTAEALRIQLDFLKPFKANNLTVFTYTPEGDDTRITWTMNGTNDFMGKLFGMCFNMDELVGKDFEKGLADLKTAAERPA